MLKRLVLLGFPAIIVLMLIAHMVIGAEQKPAAAPAQPTQNAAQTAAQPAATPTTATAQPTAQTGAVSAAQLLQPLASDVILGNANAPVTIIEYASLSCSHCARFHNEILPPLKEKYIATGQVRFINRPFPLNAPALKAAMVAECAGPQKYHTFLKVLFAEQKTWAFDAKYLELLKQIAALGGLGGEAFDRCVADSTVEKKILETRQQAEAALGVGATPTFFINGSKYEGELSFAQMEKVIAAAAGQKQ